MANVAIGNDDNATRWRRTILRLLNTMNLVRPSRSTVDPLLDLWRVLRHHDGPGVGRLLLLALGDDLLYISIMEVQDSQTSQ